MSQVALFDFDNTLYDGISYFDLLHYHVTEGLVSQSIDSQNRGILEAYKKGDITYELAAKTLLENYAAALVGIAYTKILNSTRVFFSQNNGKIYRFAQPLVTLLQPTHHILLVTGAPQFVAKNAADILRIKEYVSTTFEVMDDTFTGKILNHLAYDYEKTAAIAKHIPHIDPQNSFAFGDSEGDQAMLKLVEHAICINPTPGLHATALANNWPIVTSNTIETHVRQALA